jgi:hypothetical protein
VKVYICNSDMNRFPGDFGHVKSLGNSITFIFGGRCSLLLFSIDVR